MDFVKKHYEKILLSVVLLGLVGALVFLPVMINGDRQKLADIRTSIISHAVKPLDPSNLTEESNASARLQSPYSLDFSTTNKLFNPVLWQKAVDGSLIKIRTGNEIGPARVVVTKITPLYLVLKLDSVETNEFGARYAVTVTREAASLPAQRGPHQHYGAIGEKNEAFTIIGTNSVPGSPAQLNLILQLTDSGGRAALSKSAPYRRVDGYSADLKYDPEGRKWQAQRIGADLRFAGDDYIIVAINQDTVILSAKSNQKKTALTFSANP